MRLEARPRDEICTSRRRSSTAMRRRIHSARSLLTRNTISDLHFEQETYTSTRPPPTSLLRGWNLWPSELQTGHLPGVSDGTLYSSSTTWAPTRAMIAPSLDSLCMSPSPARYSRL